MTGKAAGLPTEHLDQRQLACNKTKQPLNRALGQQIPTGNLFFHVWLTETVVVAALLFVSDVSASRDIWVFLTTINRMYTC